MKLEHTIKFTFQMENDNGQLVVKGEIEGESEVPNYDDLKFQGIIALLNSIDQQNFSESGNHPLFKHYIDEIEETISEIIKHNQFQGKSECRDGL
ncbi:hypothetical protein [Psychrobacillus vulpis]|uniref:Uncharacterized protein n=1 Tax=Psychrobacillus vulpis TaxID=2325572 RepID=A0A544TVB6_9BACI|nr:hypothetical protein [Psychrobacillus vulpis]TQR21398.1 hypothetical protein FG384_00040 [Psychrobacillus vulpis]